MHLGALNLNDLMISLWRGTIDCTRPDEKSMWTWVVLHGEAWQQHGKAVADTLHYLPSSFDCPPRNITEKLTSGYKAWEFLLYLYGLCPTLLYVVMCMARPEAMSRAKPGQNRPGQTGGFVRALAQPAMKPSRSQAVRPQLFGRQTLSVPQSSPLPGFYAVKAGGRHERLQSMRTRNTTSGDHGLHTSQTSVETLADPDTYPTR
jgi:hypothetical protein